MEKTIRKITKNDTRKDVPVLFDDVVTTSDIYTDVLQVTMTENGITTVKAEDIDREEREAQGLSPYSGMAQVEVTVDVPTTNIQVSKSVGFTENGEYSVVPDSGFDAVAQVTVTVDTGSDIPTNPGIVKSLSDLADYANSCDVYGACLFLSEDKTQWCITNDDPNNQEWNPYGTDKSTPVFRDWKVVAVCIGNGVWLSTEWIGLTTSLKFADTETQLRNEFIAECVKGTGKYNSDFILTTYEGEIDNTNTPLWYALHQLRREYPGAYIPNTVEIHDICLKLSDTVENDEYDKELPVVDGFSYKSNIAFLLGVTAVKYYSSSQYMINNVSIYNINFFNGCVDYGNKDGDSYSIAAINFE